MGFNMVKEYELQGLACANCAGKIERDVGKLDGITQATINIATGLLQLTINDNYSGDMYTNITRIVDKHEPDVHVIEKVKGIRKTDIDNTDKLKVIRLIVGLSSLVTGLVMYWFTDINELIPTMLFIFTYILTGTGILLLAAKNIIRGKVFDENFLMSIATIGAFIIGEYADAAMIMLFYQTGTYIQNLAVLKSKRNITELMDIRPDYANLQTDGEVKKVAPETVSTGEIIVVKPGEKIPLDGVIITGESMLDTTALTGESVPRKVSSSDTVLSGCVNLNGVLEIRVTQTFGESTASKIVDLVENAASKKAPSENFITKFAHYYTPVVVSLAVLVAVIPPLLFSGIWDEWLRRGLIFLVISCPCALVISIPLSFFGGLGGASRKGILIKGSNYLEALSSLDMVVFDKTGTLTKGVFKVTAIKPSNGFSEDDLLKTAAHAEAFSSHPIALSILHEYGKPINKAALTEYNEIAGYGVSVSLCGNAVLAGNCKLMNKMGVAFDDIQSIDTKVYVAMDSVYMGYIVISDELKPDSYNVVAELKALGVSKTIMLTGDNPQIAGAIASELKLDDVYAGLLPHEKAEKAEMLISQKRPQSKLAFVGDGINDAPVLAIADIGVAMGALGSDAAIEAADVVLMTDEPSKLADAVRIARFTKRIVWQNIALALGIKAVFMILGTMGIASLWEAVFADVGVALLAILNAMRVK